MKAKTFDSPAIKEEHKVAMLWLVNSEMGKIRLGTVRREDSSHGGYRESLGQFKIRIGREIHRYMGVLSLKAEFKGKDPKIDVYFSC